MGGSMTYYTLKALEVIAVMAFCYLLQMMTIMTLSLICPPLIPLVGLAFVASLFLFNQQRSTIFRAAEYHILSADNGTTSIYKAVWSTLAASFCAGLWYPSKGLYDVLTDRESFNSLLPESMTTNTPTYRFNLSNR